jgi:hypothetical protein
MEDNNKQMSVTTIRQAVATMPDFKQAYRAIRMFKDEYLLDYINVEELGMHDEDVDERVIESNIVHNVKNFIMTFGKGITEIYDYCRV